MMGILTHFFLKQIEKDRQNQERHKQEAANKRRAQARSTILRLYNVDINGMNDKAKMDLKRKLQKPILQVIKTEFNRITKDPKLLPKIRADVTRQYGVDKDLLSEIKPSMWIFHDDPYDDAVELVDASQEVTTIAGDYFIDDIIKVLNTKFKDLVDGGIVKFGFGDGDEGIISYEMDW